MINQKCDICGKSFVISDEEEVFCEAKKLPLPKRCESCRAGRNPAKDAKTRKITSVMGIVVGALAITAAIIYKAFLAPTAESENGTGTLTENAVPTPSSVSDSVKESSTETTDTPTDSLSSETAPADESESAADSFADEQTERIYKFRSESNLQSHFEKHGREMGFSDAESYEQAAAAVVKSPEALHKIEKEDGDDVYYLESTNEFVIVSTDGYIRTYFLPSSGKSYYERQ